MLPLYLIPGLGADARLFGPLLPYLPATVRPQVLEWLPPLSPDEPLAAYAARLAAPIPTNEACWVAGVSFGGILALEIGRLRPLAHLIQISSIPAAEFLPLPLRLLRAMRLYRLSPPQLLGKFSGLAKWFFGIQDREMGALLRSFLSNMNVPYTRWAIHALLSWDSAGIRPALSLHGTHDRVFPLGHRQVEHRIAGGPHFMVYTHAKEVGAFLTEIIMSANSNAKKATSRERSPF